MIKAKKILYIIGIVFGSLLIALSVLMMLNNNKDIVTKIREYYPLFGKTIKDYYYETHNADTVVITLNCINITLIFMNMFLKKSVKSLIIFNIILSILTYNVFSLIAAIFLLVEKINENAEIEEKRKLELEKERVSSPISSSAIEAENEPKVVKKPIRLNVETNELTFSLVGIILEIMYLFTYLFLILFFHNEISKAIQLDPKEYGFSFIYVVFIWAILILALFLIPIIIIAVDIAFTILMITTRKPAFAKIIRIVGFVSLSIFNAIAAIMLINKLNNEENKELNQ